MSKTLDARLLALESVNAPDVSRRLILLTQFDLPDDDAIGVLASGPRLPNAVMRLPGESLEQLQTRAAAMITGAGPLMAGLAYRGD